MEDQIIHQELYWKQEAVTYYAQSWVPAGNEKPKQIICVLHGFGEHGGRYARMAQFFCSNGFGVIAMDIEGHGKTSGARGVLKSYDSCLDAVERFLVETEQSFIGSIKYLWGHSMGGAMVLNLILRRTVNIAAAIVASPLLRTISKPTLLEIFSARLWSQFYSGTMKWPFPSEVPVSRDENVVYDFLKDSLIHTRTVPHTLFELRDAGLWPLKNAGLLHTPCLLMHGTADRITSFDASFEFALNAPSEFLTFKAWEGFYHELHNEPEADRIDVLTFALNWIKSVSKTSNNKNHGI